MRTFMIYIDGIRSFQRITETRLRAKMYAHIKAELAKGRSLAAIEFCYTPVC